MPTSLSGPLSDQTAALALPYVMPAQAQKHVTVNTGLTQLDALVQMRLVAIDVTSPPALPASGALYGLGSGATGAFAGQDGMVARFDEDTGWQFIAPQDGWLAIDLSPPEAARLVMWQAGQWQAPDLGRITALGIGTDPDATNRLAVASPASLFSHAGSDHRMVVNKAAAADTAAVMFQSGWSGRAELGLMGDESLTLKLSPDGQVWTTVLAGDPASGQVSIPDLSVASLTASGALRLAPTTSASRPSAATAGLGACLYDSDLGQPIFSDGSQWRDAMGGPV